MTTEALLHQLLCPPVAASVPATWALLASEPDRGGERAEPARTASASSDSSRPTARAIAPVTAALEARALAGERAAWDELIRAHNHRVVVALLARGVPIDRARDLAQDAWMRLMEQQRRGALTHLALPGLAIAQAAHLLRDHARREQALWSRRGEGAEGEQHADPAGSAEDRLLSAEQLRRAARALAACSPSAQHVFRLVYEQPDARHEDVALRVGLSLQRVRQIVCEVRKRLRAAIEEDDHV